MNGWLKKNKSIIVQIAIIAIMLVITSVTIKVDVNYLKKDVIAIEIKDEKQDVCIYEINRALGRIEGKLDTALKGGE